MKDGAPVVDVDGSYLYRKQQQLHVCTQGSLDLPNPGWETVTDANMNDICTVIPHVTLGLFTLSTKVRGNVNHSQVFFIPILLMVVAEHQAMDPSEHLEGICSLAVRPNEPNGDQ